jgi:hypothetical protein
LIDDINDESAGSMISNHLFIATQLGIVYENLYFEEEIVEPVRKMSETINGRTKNYRHDKNYNKPNEKTYEEEDDERERQRLEKNKRVSVLKRSQYIGPVVRILAPEIGYSEQESIELATMICNINDNIIMESYVIGSFTKSRDVNVLMNMLIEIHNIYTTSVNVEFLKFLTVLVGIFQTCEYRLIKLGK